MLRIPLKGTFTFVPFQNTDSGKVQRFGNPGKSNCRKRAMYNKSNCSPESYRWRSIYNYYSYANVSKRRFFYLERGAGSSE